MIIIEILANKLADGIADQLSLGQERRSVIAYGLIGLLQVTTLFIVITIIGVLTSSLYESLIIFFSVGFIRKSTGGAHSRTMSGCNTISILTITMLAVLSKYILGNPVNVSANIILTIAVFAVGYAVFNLRVPVDSPNKPIVKPEKIKRLRKESFIKLSIFLLLTLGAILLAGTNERFYSIASSLRVAIIWQSITLTKIGIMLLENLDLIVNRILKKLRFI